MALLSRRPVLFGTGAALAFAALAWIAREVQTPGAAVQLEMATGSLIATRTTMSVSALLGVVALAFAMARLGGVRPAIYSAAILVTTPVWFVHGRLATFVIVPLAASALVLAGLGVVLLDPRPVPSLRVGAVLAAILGVVMSVHVNALAVVVAPPAIAVGFAAWRSRRGAESAGPPEMTIRKNLAKRNSWTNPTRAEGPPLRSIGARAPNSESKLPLTLSSVGCAAALAAIVCVLRGVDGPVANALAGVREGSASGATFDVTIAPLAYGLLPWSPLVALAIGRRPRSALHLAISLTAVLGLLLQTALASRCPSPAIVGVASIAACVALAIDELDDTDRPLGSAFPLVLVVLGALVAHDVELDPERVISGLSVNSALPLSSDGALHSIATATRAATWLTTSFATLVSIVPRAWVPIPRGLALVVTGAVSGLALRGDAWPRVLEQLSPGPALEAYARKHRAGDTLAVLDVDRKVSPLLASARSFVAARQAADWLATATASERRFVAFASLELPRLNAEWRVLRHSNVPILAGGEGRVLLAVSALDPSERSENALDRVVLDRAPATLSFPLDAVLEDRLDLLGWDLTDEAGAVSGQAPSLRSGKKAHLRFYLRPREGAPPLAGYCTFIHIDNTPKRFSAEHRSHSYPMALWRGGDVIVDDFEVVLPPAFRSGSYAIYWGVGVLPCEDDRRLAITSGPNDGRDRVPAGRLEVR